MIDQHLFDMTNLLCRERNGGATEQICPIDKLRTMSSKIVRSGVGTQKEHFTVINIDK